MADSTINPTAADAIGGACGGGACEAGGACEGGACEAGGTHGGPSGAALQSPSGAALHIGCGAALLALKPGAVVEAAVAEMMPHPALARVLMVDDVRGELDANHHGDEKRRSAAAELGEDWNAFLDDIELKGVLETLKVVVTAEGLLIVDGRHRWEACRQRGIAFVRIEIVDEATAWRYIEGSVIGRRHWTKSMRAYFAVTLHPEVAKRERGQRKSALNADLIETAADLSKRYGVSARLVEQAIELYKMLEDSPTLLEQVEPTVWAGFSLGGILSGIGGAEATKKKKRRPSNFGSVQPTLRSLKSQLSGYTDWQPTEQAQFVDTLRKTLSSLPAEALDAIRTAANS